VLSSRELLSTLALKVVVVQAVRGFSWKGLKRAMGEGGDIFVSEMPNEG